jgi:hypothetical protein
MIWECPPWLRKAPFLDDSGHRTRSNSDLEAWRLQSHGVPLAWRIQPRLWIGRSKKKIPFKANLTMKCHWYVCIYIYTVHTHIYIHTVYIYIYMYIYRYVVLWYYMNVFTYTYRQDDDFVILFVWHFRNCHAFVGMFFWFRVLHCSCHL